jgi:hypothetical protein
LQLQRYKIIFKKANKNLLNFSMFKTIISLLDNDKKAAQKVFEQPHETDRKPASADRQNHETDPYGGFHTCENHESHQCQFKNNHYGKIYFSQGQWRVSPAGGGGQMANGWTDAVIAFVPRGTLTIPFTLPATRAGLPSRMPTPGGGRAPPLPRATAISPLRGVSRRRREIIHCSSFSR